MAGVSTVEKSGLPYLTAGSSPATTAASSWIFRVGASDAFLAGAIARYVAETLHATGIAIVHDKTGIHNQRALAIGRLLESLYKIKPVLDAPWNPGKPNFPAILTDVKASGAKAVIVLGETPDGGAFFKAWKAAGIDAQVIGQRDFGVERVFTEAGSAADGALIFTEYAPDLEGEATRRWNAAYRARYGSNANVIAVQYYDAILLLAEAIRAGGPTRAGVKDALSKLKDFHGAMADYTFDAARNGVHRFYLGKIAGGKLTPVSVVDDETAAQ
jgi:branched-chain amino acid transport system substrate-binding protein